MRHVLGSWPRNWPPFFWVASEFEFWRQKNILNLNFGAKNELDDEARELPRKTFQLTDLVHFCFRQSDHCGLRTLPGFMMPLGSKACLMAHIMSTDTGPYISSSRTILPEKVTIFTYLRPS